MELPALVKSSVENPWMLKPSLQENEKLEKYYTGYKKFWDAYNEQLQKNRQEGEDHSSLAMSDSKIAEKKKSKDGDVDEIRELDTNEDEINQESFTGDIGTNISKLHSTKEILLNQVVAGEPSREHLEVNPENFLKITKSGATIVPQFSAKNSEVSDLLDESESSNDESEQRNLIAEAFEDDDVVNEFQKQKKDIVNASKPEAIDNYLPGWGSWAGKNVAENPRKRKRFTKKAKKGPQRKDSKVSHVIINEDVDEKVRLHQVSEYEFIFTQCFGLLT